MTEADRQMEYTGTRTGTDGHTDTGEKKVKI